MSCAHGRRRRSEARLPGPGLTLAGRAAGRRRTGLTPGVSFLKPVRGKQNRSVWFGCGADTRSGACPRPGLLRAVELGVEDEGLTLWFLPLMFCVVSWTCFSKPVFHFIRFGHLKIQNSMPTNTVRAFLALPGGPWPGMGFGPGASVLAHSERSSFLLVAR